jgi:tetratricopeptide (TPR) repeat protein
MFPWQTDQTRDAPAEPPRRRLRLGLPVVVLVAGAAAVAWLERDPPSAPALLDQGRRDAAIGRFSSAIGHYTNALGREPGNAELYRLRASARMNVADYPGALTDLDAALTLRPDYPQALYDRGISRWVLERHADACADLTRACALGHARACEQHRRGGCETLGHPRPGQ